MNFSPTSTYKMCAVHPIERRQMEQYTYCDNATENRIVMFIYKLLDVLFSLKKANGFYSCTMKHFYLLWWE